MRILFVHNALRSFVRTDLDILTSTHEVDELDLSAPSRLITLPGRLARADMVFAWFASAHSFGPVLGAALSRKSSVVVVGGYDTSCMPQIGYGSMAHPVKGQIVRAICHAATALVVNSHAALEEVTRTVGTDTPIHVIHHGFTAPQLAPTASREPLVLTVGAVNCSNLQRKGHDAFVQAAARVPEARFILAGRIEDGSGAYLRSIAPSNVALPGFLPQAKLDALYERASVYVQASAHEGFGCALAEAMAAGCIPVVSRRGALPEVAGCCGVYVAHDDPTSIAHGIREALAAAPESRQATRQRIEDHFPLMARRDALLELVETVAREKRAPVAFPGNGPWRNMPALDPSSARVTLILPVRNEATTIRATLESVLRQSFPARQLRILAVDGMSDDGTREIVEGFAQTHPNLHVADNPRYSASAALNIGIAAAGNADVIVRVDGHCRIAPEYVQRCVELLAETGAANVGGRMRSAGDGIVSCAVATALSSPFGIGNGRFHYLQRQAWVDTVYLGAFRSEVLHEVGGFDEELARNQDDELNYRIRAAGYGILLSPDIVSRYTPRSSLRALWRQFHGYGFWKVRVIKKHPGSVQAKHLVPALAVPIMATSALTFVLCRQRWILLPIQVYTATVASAALWTGRREIRLIPILAVVYPCMHIAYGTGFIMAAIRSAIRVLINSRSQHEPSISGVPSAEQSHR